MADIDVTPSVGDSARNELQCRRGVVDIDEDKAYKVFVDTDSDLRFSVTEDGKDTWSASAAGNEIHAGSVETFTVFHGKWLDGSSDDLIYIVLTDTVSDDVIGYTLDPSDDSVAGPYTIFNGTLVSLGNWGAKWLDLVKNSDGTFMVYFWNSATDKSKCYTTSDFTTGWTSKNSPGETTESDHVYLFPMSSTKIGCLYLDRSADELTVKEYVISTNTWSEGSWSLACVDEVTRGIWGDITCRHSDGHAIFATCNNPQNAANDVIVLDITDKDNVTAKTEPFTNDNSVGFVKPHVNQQNDDLRVHYQDGSILISVLPKEVLSDDGGGTWGSPKTIGDDVADDNRACENGCMTTDDGATITIIWWDDDNTRHYTNTANATPVTPAVTGFRVKPVDSEFRTKPVDSSFRTKPVPA